MSRQSRSGDVPDQTDGGASNEGDSSKGSVTKTRKSDSSPPAKKNKQEETSSSIGTQPAANNEDYDAYLQRMIRADSEEKKKKPSDASNKKKGSTDDELGSLLDRIVSSNVSIAPTTSTFETNANDASLDPIRMRSASRSKSAIGLTSQDRRSFNLTSQMAAGTSDASTSQGRSRISGRLKSRRANTPISRVPIPKEFEEEGSADNGFLGRQPTGPRVECPRCRNDVSRAHFKRHFDKCNPNRQNQ